MSGWAGFTDAELQKMKGPVGRVEDARKGVRKPSYFTKPNVTTQQKQMSQQKKTVSMQSETGQIRVIPPEQRLSKPQMPTNNNTDLETTGDKGKTAEPSAVSQNNTSKKDSNGNVAVQSEVSSQNSTTSVVQEVRELEFNQEEALSHQLNKFEKYQQQQKQIEELNKQRKQLLSKAISERSKKAKEEASKLKHIEKELSHLDQQLAGGVSIIRDRIEQASLAYLDAQHKYEKAEREFINAKVDLFDKAEKKEQLTEHLYTIIHQNEVRKSLKLAELMKQLEMDISADEIDIKIDLPPLSHFNAVQTLSPTKSLKSPVYPDSKKPDVECKMAEASTAEPEGNSESKMSVTRTTSEISESKMADTKTSEMAESKMADTNTSGFSESEMTDKNSISEACESKMAETSDSSGSQRLSENSGKTNFQAVKSDTCVSLTSDENSQHYSQNLEQKLPRQVEKTTDSASHT